MSPQKALEKVGNNLQKQYERWQPRARYKQLLDPTTEDVRKLCIALRKNAKVLTHSSRTRGTDTGPLYSILSFTV